MGILDYYLDKHDNSPAIQKAVDIKLSKKSKRIIRRERRLFLFNHQSSDHYEEIQHVDGYWYVKYWDGNVKGWNVAKFPNKSFQKYKKYTTLRQNHQQEGDGGLGL